MSKTLKLNEEMFLNNKNYIFFAGSQRTNKASRSEMYKPNSG